jgi:hypothetical protein
VAVVLVLVAADTQPNGTAGSANTGCHRHIHTTTNTRERDT